MFWLRIPTTALKYDTPQAYLKMMLVVILGCHYSAFKIDASTKVALSPEMMEVSPSRQCAQDEKRNLQPHLKD